jgi:Flp pilus assembly protein CpaB
VTDDAPHRQTVARQVLARRAVLRDVLWHGRRCLTAGAVLLLVLVVVQAVRPGSPPAQDSWVTRVALPAGSLVSAGDLERRRLPVTAVPTGAVVDAAQLDGRRLLLDLPAGHPLTDALLSRPGLDGLVPQGRVVTAVAPAVSEVTGLLRPGDRVDLLVAAPHDDGAATSDAEVAARRAVVLPAGLTVGTVGTDGGARAPSTDGSGAAPVLLAVTPAEAARLAGLGVWSDVTIVLVE